MGIAAVPTGSQGHTAVSTPALLRSLARTLETPSKEELTEVRAALRGLADELELSRDLTIPRLTWTYAVVSAGRVACPHCGTVYPFGKDKWGRDRYFDRFTSRIKCPSCAHVYVVGLLLWRPAPGGFNGLPPDQETSIAVAAAIRQEQVGYVATRLAKRDDPVNRFLNHECCCPPLPWRAECRVHGLLDKPT